MPDYVRVIVHVALKDVKGQAPTPRPLGGWGVSVDYRLYAAYSMILVTTW
jgi:hypothetical protein